ENRLTTYDCLIVELLATLRGRVVIGWLLALGLQSSVGLVNSLSSYDCSQYLCSKNLIGCDLGEVAVEDYEVGQHAGFQLAFVAFRILAVRGAISIGG